MGKSESGLVLSQQPRQGHQIIHALLSHLFLFYFILFYFYFYFYFHFYFYFQFFVFMIPHLFLFHLFLFHLFLFHPPLFHLFLPHFWSISHSPDTYSTPSLFLSFTDITN